MAGPEVASLTAVTPVEGGLLSQMHRRGTLVSSAASPSPMKAAGGRFSGDSPAPPHVQRSCLIQTPPRMKSFEALLSAAAAGQRTPPFERRSTDKQPESEAASSRAIRAKSSDSAKVAGEQRSSSGKAQKKSGSTSTGRKGKASKASDTGAMGPPVAAAKKRARAPPASKTAAPGTPPERRRPVRAPSTPPERRRPARLPLPPKLESEQYEISDREEESNEIMDDVDRSSKFVPEWCQDLSERLLAQADVDPDSVFGSSVPPCDLDQILSDSLYRTMKLVHTKRPRGSSCKWDRDKLQAHEVRDYSQKMGHRRRLSMFQRRSLLPNRQPSSDAKGAVLTSKPQRGGA